jgi:hypothetical protein
MTNNETDFVGPIETINLKIKGIKGYLKTTKIGTARWAIQDDQGRHHRFDIPGTYLVPDLPMRLLSPQHLAREMSKVDKEPDGTACHTYSDRVLLTWHHGKYCRTIALGKINVPVIRSAPSYNNFKSYAKENPEVPQNFAYAAKFPHMEAIDTMEMPTMDLNVNHVEIEEDIPKDTRAEDELMIWHIRLGHMPFLKLQKMAMQGDLPKRLQKCPIPKCISCLYGKATKIPWKVKGEAQSHLKQTKVPGECVSIDQMESSTPGLIAQMKGIPTLLRYKYLTVIVDHYSRFTYIHLHTAITSEETVKAKHAFECVAQNAGVIVKHYHADNGRFADKAFLNDLEEKGQTISFCGVRAHFQNGIAERRIRDLQERARTMLLHACNKWPSAMDTALWPYAIRLTCAIDNSTLLQGPNLSRSEIFSGTSIRPKLRHFHTFGCPAYVLKADDAIQRGKWKPRAHIGIYLGPSPKHARSVHLILNPLTGLVSPQFHVKFDDLFQTVPQMQIIIKWKEKCHFTPTTVSRIDVQEQNNDHILEQPNQHAGHTTPEPEDYQHEDPHMDEGQNCNPSVTNHDGNESPAILTTTQYSRYGRQLRPTLKSRESQELREAGLVSYPTTIDIPANPPIDDPGSHIYSEANLHQDLEHPMLYLCKASNDPDTLYMHEALKAPDSLKFKEAMVKEVNEHIKRRNWEPILKRDLPKGTIILPAVWAMKRKRRIDTRQVYKWKSRLNLGGHKMIKGIQFQETYSPVVSWQHIRLFLILAALNHWHTTQIDFIMAYTQAPIDKPVYMHLPPGIHLPNMSKDTHCLRILNNIYGGKDSGRIWFQHLRSKLIDVLHFQQSAFDDCIFYHGTTIFIIYTDDGILIDPCQETINCRINDIKTLFEIEIQGNLEDYLGIHITTRDDGSKTMTQPHLIDSILMDLNLLNGNSGEAQSASIRQLPSMPSRKIVADANGAPFTYQWHYRSVIGKLNFLEKSTRPDISYVVHQLARYSTKQRQSHGHAVKHLGRYLLGTRDKGLILCPKPPVTLTCYVDADFCGNWDPKSCHEDPDTARSRSGFIVLLANAPLYWQSKMQTIIALSTAESELIALSEATRFIKALTYLIDELQHRNLVPSLKPNICCKIFEDNAAAVEISKVPKIRPRTRHINVLYHHFRSEVANNRVTVEPIATHDNIADIFTKQQNTALFQHHRLKINGW